MLASILRGCKVGKAAGGAVCLFALQARGGGLELAASCHCLDQGCLDITNPGVWGGVVLPIIWC
jgi:hypothetical protein